MTWQSCLFIFDTDSIGKKISKKKTPLLSWVQILQIFSVCPGVKSRTTRMRSGNGCILIDCMTRNAMKWSFYWGSCNYRRMPSIRFLQLAGYWTISLVIATVFNAFRKWKERSNIHIGERKFLCFWFLQGIIIQNLLRCA